MQPGRPSLETKASTAYRARAALPALGVIVTTVIVFGLVRLTGGLPNALNNLSFLAVIIGSLGYGAPGGLGAAVVVAVLLGPVGAATGMPTDSGTSWIIRFSTMSAVAIVNGLLVDRARHAAARWRDTAERAKEGHRNGMLVLARAAEAKDEQTGDHLRRVQVTAAELALSTGAGQHDAEEIGWAAMLHDLGKLHIPDSLLQKPGPLTPEEWVVVRTHTVRGAEILGASADFETARRVARWHHENIDGSGYPDGLRGGEIPLEARIVRIADAFDAMTNDRPYSRARSVEEALEELFRYSGLQFDPELVRLMEQLVGSGHLSGEIVDPKPGHAPTPVVAGLVTVSAPEPRFNPVLPSARPRRLATTRPRTS